MKDPNRFNKPKKREYLFDIIPRWIRYSGLPGELYKKYGSHAWPILSCLISLDCRFNPDDPDWFGQSYREIAELTGIQDLKTIRRYINKFEKAGLISVIRGKFKGLKSKFRIADPLPTPKDPNSIEAVNGGFLGRRGKEPDLRYWQRGAQRPPLGEKERGANETPKGGKRDPKGGHSLPTLKNDYKNDKEKNSNSCANLSLEKRSKPTTWEEGIVRARDIKKMLRKPRPKEKRRN